MRDYDFSLYKRPRLRGIGHMTDEEQSLDLNLQLSYSNLRLVAPCSLCLLHLACYLAEKALNSKIWGMM